MSTSVSSFTYAAPQTVDLSKLLGMQSNIQGMYGTRYAEAMKMLQGLGTQQKKDIETQYRGAESRGAQDLMNSGLYKSTILPSMRMGYNREMSNALGRLNDQLNQQQLGLHTQMSGEEIQAAQNFMNLYAQAMQQSATAKNASQSEQMRMALALMGSSGLNYGPQRQGPLSPASSGYQLPASNAVPYSNLTSGNRAYASLRGY